MSTTTQAIQTAPPFDPANQGQDVPAAWNQVAAGYDTHVTHSGISLGEVGIAALELGAGQRFLDVAAGTGALSIAAAKRGADVTAIDFAPEMIARLRSRMSAAGLSNVRAEVMDGTDLRFEDDAFDAAGSQFGVMLFPDYARGIRELVRVTKPGGQVLLITMGPASQVEFLTHFVGAVQRVVPGFKGLPTDPPPLPLRLAEPDRIRDALAAAGLRDIQVERTTYSVEHPSAKHLWDWVANSNPIGAKLAADAD